MLRIIRNIFKHPALALSLAFAGACVGSVPAVGADGPPKALAALPGSPGGPAAAPVAIAIRVWAHKGYGRVVFDWPKTIGYSAKIQEGALVVRFEKPWQAKFEDIRVRLSAYVAKAAATPDGRELRLVLENGVRFRTFRSEDDVVVDLIGPKAAKASAKKPPAAKSGKPRSGKKRIVAVRSAEHAGFSRIVFDWPGSVAYKVGKKGTSAFIRFDRPARFDLRATLADLPPFVTSVRQHTSLAGGSVTFGIVKGARLRHFRYGTSIVLDILRPVTARSSSAKPEAKATPKPKAKAKAKTAAPAKSVKPKTAIAKPRPLARPTPRVANAKPAQKSATPAPAKAAPVPARPVRKERAARAAAQPTTLLAERLRKAARSLYKIPVNLSLTPKTATLRFRWAEGVGAAVFVRAGILWAVFDREAAMEFKGWAKDGPALTKASRRYVSRSFVSRPQSLAHPGAAIFRMRIPAGVQPRVERDGTVWTVALEREYLVPASGITVESHIAASAGGRLFIAAPDASQALSLKDPEVGDRIWVVPLEGAGKGIGLARRFAEVELLAAAQGIAGTAQRDSIRFRTLPKGIEVYARGGLSLSGSSGSGVGLAVGRLGGKGASKVRPGWLFDFERWRGGPGGSFVPRKHELLRAAATSEAAVRNGARFQLAQLFFAYNHLTDVIGLLQVIVADEPERANEPLFRALRGASYYRLGEFERARRDLFHESLAPFKETSLWRAALEATSGNWEPASRYFSRAETVITVYPKDLRIHFGALAAETALNIGDVGLAKFHIDSLAALATDPRASGRISYLRGRLLAKVLDPEGAVQAWGKAAIGSDRPTRVKAVLARTAQLRKMGKLTKSDAIKELEKLRYSWRGDGLEFKVLKRLGTAYIEFGDYKNGLITLRDAARYFPKHPGADGVIDTMRAAFVRLYVDGEADKIAPLTALALYDEFRELTPQGKVGDSLIAKLADRLVDVDLLERAASLLKHLVDRRLKGTDKFVTANRLALVYILDRKPEEALSALAGQVPHHIIPDSATIRRHLKARAMGELARYKDALRLLAGDKSYDAALLRAEIHWRLRDWSNASKAYSILVKSDAKAAGKKPFDDKTKRNVLNLAITYALSRNRGALDGLRRQYGKAMAKGRYTEAFELVTGYAEAVPNDYSIISKKVAEVDQFGAFLKSYREKLLNHASKPARQAGKVVPTGSG